MRPNLEVAPWDSLVSALRFILRNHGTDVDPDDLTAALGLSMMTVAVADEPEVARWCLYARDTFLETAAALFGIEIREIHPPEAAVGLAGFAEFEQHFDASYRPLIANALSHGQSVLAWRGWAATHEGCWGLIQSTCNAGVGFNGSIVRFPRHDPEKPATIESVLEHPPVQLYVAERISHLVADPADILDAAIEHAALVLTNGVGSRFAVTTGPAAFDQWIARIDPADAHSSLAQSRALASALADAHATAVRFWRRAAATQDDRRQALETLVESATEIENALRIAASMETESASGAALPLNRAEKPSNNPTPHSWKSAFRDALLAARAATLKTAAAIQAARPAGQRCR